MWKGTYLFEGRIKTNIVSLFTKSVAFFAPMLSKTRMREKKTISHPMFREIAGKFSIFQRSRAVDRFSFARPNSFSRYFAPPRLYHDRTSWKHGNQAVFTKLEDRSRYLEHANLIHFLREQLVQDGEANHCGRKRGRENITYCHLWFRSETLFVFVTVAQLLDI